MCEKKVQNTKDTWWEASELDHGCEWCVTRICQWLNWYAYQAEVDSFVKKTEVNKNGYVDEVAKY